LSFFYSCNRWDGWEVSKDPGEWAESISDIVLDDFSGFILVKRKHWHIRSPAIVLVKFLVHEIVLFARLSCLGPLLLLLFSTLVLVQSPDIVLIDEVSKVELLVTKG